MNLYHMTEYIPVPNFALIDRGAWILAVAESVGPKSVRHFVIALAPFNSMATTGPLSMNSTKQLKPEPLTIRYQNAGKLHNLQTEKLDTAIGSFP